MSRRNPERDAEIVTLYQSGLALAAVGARFGLTRERIRQILNVAGVSERHRGSSARRMALEAFAYAESEGLSIGGAARRYGLSADALGNQWRRLGLKLPARVVAHSRYRYLRYGCRCDVCKEAVREHSRSLKTRGPPHHGTASGYRNYGCRCDLCRQAGSEDNRRQRLRRKQRALE